MTTTESRAQPSVDENEFATTIQQQSFNLAHAESLLNSNQRFPQLFGDYILESELGRGSTGTVYVAKKEGSDQLVAIKVISARDCQVGQRFQLEVQALAKLDHPNICPVLDVGEVGDDKYFTMPLIRGKTLSEFVCRDNVLPVKEIARILKAVAYAVQHAHDVGVVHRDLKPANIIIQPNGQPMVIDFGLAKFLCRESDVVPEGALLGTPAYMSPEQVIGKHNLVGPASDIHALGAIMYHLLTCRLPYDGSIDTIFDQILNAEPELPTRFRGRLHVGLEQVCLKAMAKEVGDRHPCAEYFAQEIINFEQVRLRAKQRRYLLHKSADTNLTQAAVRRNNRPNFRRSNDDPNPSLKFAMFAAVAWVVIVIVSLLCSGLSPTAPSNRYTAHVSKAETSELSLDSTRVDFKTDKKNESKRNAVDRIQKEKFWKQLSGLDHSIQQILANHRQASTLASSANLSTRQ
jgi:serine/threonine protein kinase